jgi:hypothetical protein
MNSAAVLHEKNAGPILLINERKTLPVPGQSGESVDKFQHIHTEKCCNPVWFRPVKPDISGLPAAGMTLDSFKIK